jgi:AraC-like DNA-binding protein
MSVPEPIGILLLLGSAQGVLLALLLLTRGTNVVPNRFLAASTLGFAILMFEAVYYADGWYERAPHLIGISEPVIYLYGPLLYFYARCMSEGAAWIGPRHLLHFLPAVLVAAYLVPFFAGPGSAKIALLHEILAGRKPLDLEIIENLTFPHGLIYSFVTLAYLRRRRARLKESLSNLDRINLRWLQVLILAALAVWIPATLFDLLGFLGLRSFQNGVVGPAPLATVVIVYGIGYMALRQPEILGHPVMVARDDGRPGDRRGVPPATALEPEPDVPDARYARSGLSAEKGAELHRALLALMDEARPYLRSELTLPELAGLLSTSAHNLSEVINSRIGLSFYDFVNKYRVEEVRRRLVDPRLAHQTLLAIALDTGFGSKSSFNEIFKKHTGMTPSRYRARELESSRS